MNAHVNTDQKPAVETTPTDHFEMEVCDHARKARATSIIAGKLKSGFGLFAASQHQMPASALVSLTKPDFTLLLDYIEDMENEARCLRERFYEVME